jgi:hypothetical protein
MVKETKYLKKLARKAEVYSRASPDEEDSRELARLANAYRAQAKALRKTKKNQREKLSN